MYEKFLKIEKGIVLTYNMEAQFIQLNKQLQVSEEFNKNI